MNTSIAAQREKTILKKNLYSYNQVYQSFSEIQSEYAFRLLHRWFGKFHVSPNCNDMFFQTSGEFGGIK